MTAQKFDVTALSLRHVTPQYCVITANHRAVTAGHHDGPCLNYPACKVQLNISVSSGLQQSAISTKYYHSDASV